MAKLFISFLGTNEYIDCHYGISEKVALRGQSTTKKERVKAKEKGNTSADTNVGAGSSGRQGEKSAERRSKNGRCWTTEPVKYVQDALVRLLCHNWTPQDRVRIFTTEAARIKNWIGAAKKDSRSPRLEQCLQEATQETGVNVKNIDIPEGVDEKQLWKLFLAVLEEIQQGDEIYLDITHAFRSIPMLAFTVLEHARSLKKATVGGIFYGAFETLGPVGEIRNKVKTGKVSNDELEVPILDLTPLWTSHRWSIGVRSFIQHGQIGEVSEVLQKVLASNNPKKYPPEEKTEVIKKRRHLISLSDYLKVFSQAHLLGNLPALVGLPSVEKDFDALIEGMGDLMPNQLVKPMIEQFKDAHQPYKRTGGARILAGIHWCLDHGLYPQAMTIAREAVITATCVLAKIPDWWDINQGRSRAESAVGAFMASANKNAPTVLDRTVLETICDVWDKNELSTLSKLKAIRNDLNHAGLSVAKRAQNLGQKAEKNTFESIIKRINQTGNEILQSAILKPLKNWSGEMMEGAKAGVSKREPTGKNQHDPELYQRAEKAAAAPRQLLCLLNHALTDQQVAGAKKQLGVDKIVTPPPAVKQAFSSIPAETKNIAAHLQGVAAWLKKTGAAGDCVLVQGEHGATFALVQHARTLGMVPVHATSRREAEEIQREDGSVTTKRVFRHVLFREYASLDG